jgi:hypothetical protein
VVKDSVLTDPGLPEDPGELLAEHAEQAGIDFA